MNFAKFLRTPFLQNTSGRLLLNKESPIIRVVLFFHLPSSRVSRSLVSSSNLLELDVAIRFLYSFKKRLTFFHKVVENFVFANAINFALLIKVACRVRIAYLKEQNQFATAFINKFLKHVFNIIFKLNNPT